MEHSNRQPELPEQLDRQEEHQASGVMQPDREPWWDPRKMPGAVLAATLGGGALSLLTWLAQEALRR